MCYSFLNLSLKGVILSIRVVLYLVGVVLFPLIGSLPFLYYYSQVLIIANESEPSVIFIVSTLFRIIGYTITFSFPISESKVSPGIRKKY